MVGDRKTKRGVGVAPEPVVLARKDWASDPPTSLIELRRSELRHARHVAIAKTIGSVALIAGGAALFVATISTTRQGIGAAFALVAWGVRSLIPNVVAIQTSSGELTKIALHALPEARVVTR